MRRPLKPFVTEYKGTRRQGPSLQSPSLQTPSLSDAEPTPRSSEFRAFESERSRPRPVDLTAREDSDDSYEAAMRAADALFARPTPKPAQSPVAASGTLSDGTDVGSSPAGVERGGRVLRALDEPPPPQLVALEAAHTPKRRGRKPGSKNKPKLIPAEVASAVAVAPVAPERLFREVPAAPSDIAAPTAQADTTSTLRGLEAIPAAAAPSAGSPSNVSKRFSWVRDRLKPGEAWKRRRLPRICW